jgi:hypothetical protein
VLEVLLACAAMFLRDGACALLTVCESRGHALLSGLLDVVCDISGTAVTVFGAGAVITHGLSPHVLVLMGCLFATSFCTTALFTKVGTDKIGVIG